MDYNNYIDKYQGFAEDIVGKAVISLGAVAPFGLGYPGLGKGVQYDRADVRLGFCTGYYSKIDNITYAQIEFETPQGSEETGYHQFGYVDTAQYRLYEYGEKSDVKAMINELISNNKTIYENNLLCAGLISKLETRGINCTTHRRQLVALHNRLMYRNNRIQNSAFIKEQKTATPVGFDRYAGNLMNIVNTAHIGMLPVVIVVTVVITLLATWILYLLFKPDYTDSKADLKISKNLASALATLSPEAKAEVIKDLEGQVDKAYLAGKMNGSGMGILKTVGYGLAGVLGFMFLTNLNNKIK